MTVDNILKILKKEIGTTEFPANSNKQKYGKEYGLNGAPWCVIFIWWAFAQAKASSLFYGGNKTASCGELKAYGKKVVQWVATNYRPGDLVMMNFKGGTTPQHIGFLVKVEDGKFYTIEGNTSIDSKGSQSNGGAVAEKVRTSNQIVGAYRPIYNKTVTTSVVDKVVNPKARQLKEGSQGDVVKVLQSALNTLEKAKLTVDGEFGPATKEALIEYQKANRLKCGSADGVCGEKTWSCLLS